MALGDTKSLQDLEFGGARTLAMIMDPALNAFNVTRMGYDILPMEGSE